MSLSTLHHDPESKSRTASDLTVPRQEEDRLPSVANVVFVDPLVRALNDENKRLQQEVLTVSKELSTTQAILNSMMEHFLGTNTFLVAIKNFNNTHLGARCNCPHCTRALMLPPLRQNADRLCNLFAELVQMLEAHEISFVCLAYRNGDPLEGLTPAPADFPPPGIAFDKDTISHLDVHIVFEQVWNAYDFKYGKKLWSADTPYHPEIFKVYSLMRHMYQRDGY